MTRCIADTLGQLSLPSLWGR